MPDVVCINRICSVISVGSQTAGFCTVIGLRSNINITIPGQC